MLIIDYNSIAIGNVLAQGAETSEEVLRHTILASVRKYRTKFREHAKNTIIVSDGKGNWRKDIFPQYKHKRKISKAGSNIDWDQLFKTTNMVFEEISEYFPYITLCMPGCEADDTIAQIVFDTQEFGNHEDVMIISSDKDFIQLHKYKNVRQYSPITRREIKHPAPHEYVKEHILKGDSTDGVPNVLSHDDTFVDDVKSTVLSAKKKKSLLENPEGLGQDVYRNYLRNQKLIDLSFCPEDVKSRILDEYETKRQKKPRNRVFNYLVKNQCVVLLEGVQDFA